MLRVANTPGVLVHCELGRNRTGYMVAAYRIIMENQTALDAFDEMCKLGGNPKDANRTTAIDFLKRFEQHREEWLNRIAR